MAKKIVEDWLAELGTDKEQFCEHTGLSVQELNSSQNISHRVRIKVIQSIFEKLVTWFNSSKYAWGGLQSSQSPGSITLPCSSGETALKNRSFCC